jgi:hypothetical protein
MEMSIEHWCNYNDGGKPDYSEEKPVPLSLCPQNHAWIGKISNPGYAETNVIGSRTSLVIASVRSSIH